MLTTSFKLAGLLTVLTLCPCRLDAQQYEPSYETPRRGELIAVFISTSTCVGNANPDLDKAIRTVKATLAKRSKAAGLGFAAVGVASQWSVADGLKYLLDGASPMGKKDFGQWDEVAAGRNWIGMIPSEYVWRDSAGQATVPQLIILERTLQPGQTRIAIGKDRVLQRLNGAVRIVAWAKAGAPTPQSSLLHTSK